MRCYGWSLDLSTRCFWARADEILTRTETFHDAYAAEDAWKSLELREIGGTDQKNVSWAAEP